MPRPFCIPGMKIIPPFDTICRSRQTRTSPAEIQALAGTVRRSWSKAGAVLLAFALMACATAPIQHQPLDLRNCTSSMPCTVLHIDNGFLFDLTLYVNHSHFAEVGYGKKTFALPRSLFDGAGCVQMVVRERISTRVTASTIECPQPGEALLLKIDPQFHAWLVRQ